MKIGINVKIDVTKIDKSKLFKGAKGTYLDLTTFVDTDEADQYGTNGFISHSVSKEERDRGEKGRILGNCKVFYTDGRGGASEGLDSGSRPKAEGGQPTPQAATIIDDDIPF